MKRATVLYARVLRLVSDLWLGALSRVTSLAPLEPGWPLRTTRHRWFPFYLCLVQIRDPSQQLPPVTFKFFDNPIIDLDELSRAGAWDCGGKFNWSPCQSCHFVLSPNCAPVEYHLVALEPLQRLAGVISAMTTSQPGILIDQDYLRHARIFPALKLASPRLIAHGSSCHQDRAYL
jgi:hypothetical protein